LYALHILCNAWIRHVSIIRSRMQFPILGVTEYNRKNFW
jgi:hypothetical protein